MSALQLFTLVVVAALVGVSHAQVLGRRTISSLPLQFPYYPDPCYYGGDDLSALLLLAKAMDKSSNDINSNDIINKLLNALIYTTTNAGGACPTSGSKPSTTPSTGSNKNPALIDLGLLTGDDLLDLMLAGQEVLKLDLGNKGGTGGAVSNLLGGLL